MFRSISTTTHRSFLTICALVWATACVVNVPPPPEENDAGEVSTDAGVHHHDAGQDAGHDGGHDAGEPDAGAPDAGHGHDGGWPTSWQAPEPLPSLNTNYNDDQPALTSDGLMICFMSDRPGGRGAGDIWCATRASTDQPFDVPVNQVNLNTSADESQPGLRADGREIFFASNATGYIDLYRAEWSDAAGTFGTPTPVSELNTGNEESGPGLSNDGLSLYFATDHFSPGQTAIYVTQRLYLGGIFGTPLAVAGVNSATGASLAPKITPDGKLMTFCYHSDATGWQLRRAEKATNGGWLNVGPITFDSISAQSPCSPQITADGSLYFHAGVPGHADGDIWVAAPNW